MTLSFNGAVSNVSFLQHDKLIASLGYFFIYLLYLFLQFNLESKAVTEKDVISGHVMGIFFECQSFTYNTVNQILHYYVLNNICSYVKFYILYKIYIPDIINICTFDTFVT